MFRTAVIVAIGLLAAPASGQVRQDLPERGALDWTRGLILEVGAGAADLRAPRPEVARLAAERAASERAAARLATSALAIPVAAGGTVADALDDDGRARLARAIAAAVPAKVDHGSDGSVVLTAGLPLEAVRLAITGLPGPTAIPDGAPTAIVVDARGVVSDPALGFTLTLGDTEYGGPVLFFREPAAAASDPRLGKGAVQVRAARRDGAALQLVAGPDLDQAGLARAAAAGAPVALVIGEKP